MEEQSANGKENARYKARLVAVGLSQVEYVAYSVTFAPVMKFMSVKMILSVASANDLLFHQMDTFTAFINAAVKKQVLMEHSFGNEQDDPAERARCLKKALYGLKQASWQWYPKIDNWFTDGLELIRSSADDYYLKQFQRVSWSCAFMLKIANCM